MAAKLWPSPQAPPVPSIIRRFSALRALPGIVFLSRKVIFRADCTIVRASLEELFQPWLLMSTISPDLPA